MTAIRLTIGKDISVSERLEQAAELQKCLREVARTGDVGGIDALIDVELSPFMEREDDAPPPAKEVGEILWKVASAVAAVDEFDSEVTALPADDMWAGTEGYSAFWTPAGEEEVRANITAVAYPPIKTLYACGDPEKLVEMEADPDWAPRHDPKTMKLRYADYAGERMVQFSFSDVKEWIAKGRISSDDVKSLSKLG